MDRRRAHRLALALLVAACGGQETRGDAGSEPPDGGAPPDAALASDAGEPSHGGCDVRISSSPRTECSHTCDARLLLVSGEYYCTFQCSVTEDCAHHGAGLDCIAEIGGACAPRCDSDDDCPPGFYRCDPAGGFCDTYPVE